MNAKRKNNVEDSARKKAKKTKDENRNYFVANRVHKKDETILAKDGDASANKNADLEENPLKERQELVTQPNIDLLFSLFQSVEEKCFEQPKNLRGRPRKMKKIVRDDDPYLTSSAAESLIPVLSKGSNWNAGTEQRPSVVSTKLLTNGTHANFSKILSELVVKL